MIQIKIFIKMRDEKGMYRLNFYIKSGASNTNGNNNNDNRTTKICRRAGAR